MILVRPISLFAALVLACLPGVARADIWTRVDREGVVHFTNIPPSDGRWRRIMRTGPGKALTIHARRRTAGLSADRYTRFDPHIHEAATLYHLPEDLLRAVAHVESDFDPQALSSAGAMGLMQLMPGTARLMGVSDPWDPRQNVFGGARYLRVLANQFQGDLVRTLASYHAGPGAVVKYGGLPPYETTYRYVQLVLQRFRQRRKLDVYGELTARAQATSPWR